MLVATQQKLQVKPEDQPAMGRRLRNYTFKSLPEPKKKAAGWLRENPMHCVVWAAEKACRVNNDDESDDTGPVTKTKQLISMVHYQSLRKMPSEVCHWLMH